MKLNTSTEKVLYWIYKSPTLYTDKPLHLNVGI